MSWWNFWQRPGADKLDGYEPPQAVKDDPWTQPAVLAAIEKRERSDAFVNTLTGIGDFLRDKTLGGLAGGPNFEVRLLSGVDCENRWRGSDLGGRIVETIPDEMTREGFSLHIQPDESDDKADAFPPDQPPPFAAPAIEQGPKPLPEIDDSGTAMAEEIQGRLDKINVEDVFWEALSYERAFGGAAILLGAQDGYDLTMPLDEENIDDVTHLTAFRGGWDGELIAWSYYSDPTKPNYGMPEMYMLRNLGVPAARIPAPGQALTAMPATNTYGSLIYWVHESRLLVFPGVAVSRRARNQMRGWGDSVFTRVDTVLMQYDQTWGGVANLMTDFSQGVLAIDGLAEAMAANNKAATGRNLNQRALSLQMARSISRILLIDKDEEFRRDTASLAGIADVLEQFALRLAAAADMPVALLMGQAPAGLNATGASDIRFFYDRVAARQKKRMLPQLRRLIHLLMVAKKGPTDGTEPEKWAVTFNPLYQETAGEKAARTLQVAQADQIYITNQVVTPEEVAATRFGGSEFNDGAIVLDFEGREEMAAQVEADTKKREAEAKKQAAQALANQQKQPDPNAPDDNPEGKPGSGGHTVKVSISPNKDEWSEEDHPRAEDGKFGEGGGSAEAKAPTSESSTPAATPASAAPPKAKGPKVIKAPLAKTPAEIAQVKKEFAKKGLKLTDYQAKFQQVAPTLKFQGNTTLGKTEGEKWGHEHYDSWKAGLTAQENTSVQNYSGNQFSAINGSLRRGNGSHADIAHIDSALAKSPGLDHPLTVFRGADLPKGLIKPGATFTDKGYVSTSVNKDSQFTGNTQFVISVPAGHKGAYLVQSHRPEEREYLMPRGTTFNILEVHEANGVRYVKAEVTGHSDGFSYRDSADSDDSLPADKFTWNLEDLEFDDAGE